MSIRLRTGISVMRDIVEDDIAIEVGNSVFERTRAIATKQALNVGGIQTKRTII